MSRAIVLLIASFMFVPCMGCGIPLMVAVVPCVGGGRVVEFRDWNGKSIDADGLLLVCRHRDWRPILKVKSAMTTHVVEVRRGEARIPVEWVPASLWLDLEPVASLIGSLIVAPPPPGFAGFVMAGFAYGFAASPVVIPAEEVYLIPLVHGHHAMLTNTFCSPYVRSRGRLVPNEPIEHEEAPEFDTEVKVGNDSPLRLTANGDDPDAARSFWEFARERILPPDAQFDCKRGLQVRMLYNRDYQRVQALIEVELESLGVRTIQDIAASMVPGDNHN